jgi:pimeloyl-ACP methyl ester carboxylesterase
MASRRTGVRKEYEAVELPIWLELMAGLEMLYLRVSPIYWGFGVPQGDGSAVVVVPGFMLNDLYLTEFRAWLSRIGYRAYGSGIGINAECPNLLIKNHLIQTVEKAYTDTGKKVHVIGHSLGGVLARAIASQMPGRVASVITLGSPFRGVAVHPMILRAVNLVRGQIHQRNGEEVLPSCYTGACTCCFLESLVLNLPRSVRRTAVFTRTDGIVDWRVCKTGNRANDFEVTGSHIGMVFNSVVYDLVARRLAGGRGAPS